MPILWRYLLKHYLRVFLLCVSSFVAILLVTRIEEIARFAALDSGLFTIFLFTSYQIPYILPFAIPISALISTMLLLQTLSETHELTAFRACGLSLKAITAPLLIIAVFLSLLNFLIVSELTPHCRLLSRELIHKITTVNPLFLLKKSKLMNLPDTYVDMQMVQIGKEAKDVIFVMKNQKNNRLNLLTAKSFSLNNELLIGKNVSIISHLPIKVADKHDHLIVENQSSMTTNASTLTQLMQKSGWNIGFEHFPLKYLLLNTHFDHHPKGKTLKRARYELSRRIFFPCITFSFSLIGLSFGMQIGRRRRLRGVIWALVLASFTFVCFLTGKSFHLSPSKAFLCFLLPHPIIAFFALRYQRYIAKGALQ